jgi:hypothetical protein
MSEAKEVLKKHAKELLDKAISEKVRFPKIYDDAQKMKEIAGFLMAKKGDDGGYDTEAAYESIIDKYGVDEVEESKKRKNDKVDDNDDAKDEDEDDEAGKPKKEKKTPKTQIFKNYGNQALHDQLLEMSRYYFAQKEGNKLCYYK